MTIRTTHYITVAALAMIWSLLSITVFFAAIPDSPMRPSLKEKVGLLTVLPEGWGFFTRSPREESIFALGRSDAGWQELNFTATSARNWGGFLRVSRVQGVELSALTEGLKEEDWTSHPDPFARDADLSAITRREVKNPAVVKTMCGEILLERRSPVPWAWSRSERPIRMPAKYVLLAVDCAAAASAEKEMP
jgi:antimicrobial peptide system SdpA family protein